ncbi:MAG: DUF1595 domain-containing protein, partial [Planctomycetaceae bacterium]|nr:DUF1595 domain-containing protein [Planctomycetaceae bacterium]
MTPRYLPSLLLLCALIPLTESNMRAAAPSESPVQKFLAANCQDCHTGESAEGGFRVESLSADLSNPSALLRWIRVYDRVKAGEMPPADASDLKPTDRDKFLSSTKSWMESHQRQEWNSLGRVRGRRLTNLQLERTLQDLLGIDIPLANRMPDESKTNGFTTVADGQSLSHFQLEQHLKVVDVALDEAFRRATSAPDEREWELSAQQLSRRRARSRTREPELIGQTAVTWASRLVFYGRLPSTTARESGWYRFTVKASALKSPENHGVWCTVRTGRCVSSAPLLNWVGAFEVTEKPQSFTYEAWIPKGEMLEIRPGDNTLKMARFQGGQVGTGEGGPQNVPGVALHSIKMQRIHRGPTNEEIRGQLFGNLTLETKNGKRELVSKSPKQATVALMQQFARRAFRRPVAPEDVTAYVEMVREAVDNGQPLEAALRGGYRALLCSPRFLYFHEKPGQLDDYA